MMNYCKKTSYNKDLSLFWCYNISISIAYSINYLFNEEKQKCLLYKKISIKRKTY